MCLIRCALSVHFKFEKCAQGVLYLCLSCVKLCLISAEVVQKHWVTWIGKSCPAYPAPRQKKSACGNYMSVVRFTKSRKWTDDLFIHY